MRGSVHYQIQRLFAESGVNCIGQSKHTAKADARAAGAVTSADVGAQIGIYSHNTADSYREVWRQVLDHAKSEFGVRDVEKIGGVHVQAYLEAKIETGVRHATFMAYSAACAKLERALNGYAARRESGSTYNFRDGIAAARQEAHAELARFSGSRAYGDPRALIGAMHDKNQQLAAMLQHQGGARINEISLVKAGQLRGLTRDSVTGRVRGTFTVQGKGGKTTTVAVAPTTYARLESIVREQGAFQVGKDAYRADLRQAAAATGQSYNASHGLRWCFAQERYAELQRHGCTAEEALVLVSHDMGHNRADITCHYLR